MKTPHPNHFAEGVEPSTASRLPQMIGVWLSEGRIAVKL
jgi:hypothetical protein